MDESCTTNYAYISCCIILLLNIIYLGFTSIKFFIQHRRRRRQRIPRRIPKMTENTTESVSSRVATRSSTAAAAAAAAATATRVTTNKTGYERLAQLYPHVGDDTHLPSKWNGKEKAPTLVLQQNDLVVTYRGTSLNLTGPLLIKADGLSSRTWQIA